MSSKRKFIYLPIVVLVVSVIFYVYRTNRLRDFEQIKNKGVLRVTTNYNSVDYFMDGDSVRGFQYELIEVLCDSLGVQAEWIIENSLDKNRKDLTKGNVDLIARNIPVTTALRQQLAFSHPIIHTKQLLVQRKAEYNNGIQPLRNQLLLAKKTVYVPSNSPSLLRLKNLESEIADTIFIKEMPNYEAEQLIMMVAKGDIDFAVCDAQVARINATLLPEIDIQTAISFTQMQSWAMRPSSTELQAKVDSFLVYFLETKAYRDIYRKYYK